ncbi:MAG: GMC family oxidoreductase [Chloroflexi bacterium]|nr:GMC family oxidoreductase [Chloroflexota bacterium]
MVEPKVDVVIIGVGCAGGILARELAEAGLKVVGLERGPNITTGMVFQDEYRFPIRQDVLWSYAGRPGYTWRQNAQAATRIFNNGRGWGVGGEMLHWGCQTWRYYPHQFKMLSTYGPKEGMDLMDWPVTYDEMEPYYQKFEERLGISGDHTQMPHYPPRNKPYPMPPHPFNCNQQFMFNALKAQGYSPFQNFSGTNSVAYDGRPGCQYCGFCGSYECTIEAKADTRVSEIRKATLSPNFELRTDSKVFHIHTDDNGRGTGVHYWDKDKRIHDQPADIIIIACHAWHNAQQLLLGTGSKHPRGIGNNNGMVGKFLQSHGNFTVNGLFDTEWLGYAIPAGTGVGIDDWTGDYFDYQALGFIEGAILTAGNTPGQAISYATLTVPGVPTWGKERKDFIRNEGRKILTISAQPADLPSERNFIDLDPTVKDPDGLPVPRLTHDWHPQMTQLHAFIRGKMVEMLEKAGARRVWGGETMTPPSATTHLTGGAIMGEDTKRSVVNRYCQVHDAPNVFVVGPSAFPYIATWNGTEPIGALAYWVADFIKAEVKSGRTL